MKNINIFEKIIQWIITLTLPLLFISSSIAICFNCNELYHMGYERYDVVRETGVEIETLDYITDEIIKYFNDTESDNDLEVIITKNNREISIFTEREVIHMSDVKKLVQLDYTILKITFIINALLIAILLFKKKYLTISKSLINCSIVSIVIMAVIGIAMAIDFYDLFVLFHEIAFSNDYWLLDWTTWLIMLFPEHFWFDCLVAVISIIIIELIISTLTGLFLRKRYLKH